MSTLTLKAGARASQLSVSQSSTALDHLRGLVPGLDFELITLSSPGDEDRLTDLRVSAPDFFTRYLDEQLLDGTLDFALHSAKDMVDPVPEGIEWCWLPWHEDRRDACIYGLGRTPVSLSDTPVIGISSDRREAYCRKRWPNAIHKPIRGNIEDRLEQLDRGDFDIVLMAGCALQRLGLARRISEWIPLDELDTPAGQGWLGMTFRADDQRLLRLRNLLLKAVTLISAGPGDPGLCTLAGAEALRSADICLYDALAPNELLALLPPHAEAIYVGKRNRNYSVGRRQLEQLMVDFCRQGKRVVRLKGGDAGIFARLAQETEALARRHLPFRVIAGVSSLQAATTQTGLMLTRKGVSRGFSVVTPEQLYEDGAGVGMSERLELPLGLFMAVNRVRQIVDDLLAEGRPESEPATMIFGASTAHELRLTGTLADIADQVERYDGKQPGILLVGAIAAAEYFFDTSLYALEKRRVLLTCSERVMPDAVQAVHDLGGVPVPLPLIRLQPEPEAIRVLNELAAYDWLVVTSPSGVDACMELLTEADMDIRRIPRLLTCGAGTAAAWRRYGLKVNGYPDDAYNSISMLTLAKGCIKPGERVLRLRSDQASTQVAEALRETGAEVTDQILYRNLPVRQETLPPVDAIFLASGSAVHSFVEQWGTKPLRSIDTVAIGKPTAEAMAGHDLQPTIISPVSTARGSIRALAAKLTVRALQV